MPKRESFSGDLARVAKRADGAKELGWGVRAPRPDSWPPPIPLHRVPVPPPTPVVVLAPLVVVLAPPVVLVARPGGPAREEPLHCRKSDPVPT